MKRTRIHLGAGVLVTAAGLALVARALSYAGAPTAHSPEAWAATCEEFLSSEKDPNHSGTGRPGNVPHEAFRSSGWSSLDLAKGDWIGSIANRGQRPAFPHGKPRQIPPNREGCVHFQKLIGGGNSAKLVIPTTSGEETIGLQWAMFCRDTTHQPDVKPKWITPKSCGLVTVTGLVEGVPQTDTILPEGDRTTVTPGQIVSLLRQRFGVALAEEFDKAPGPWFPCEESGCCQAQ